MLEVPLPVDAVAYSQVCVTGYFDKDGSSHYCVSTGGEAPASTLLGLLALAQHDLIQEAHA